MISVIWCAMKIRISSSKDKVNQDSCAYGKQEGSLRVIHVFFAIAAGEIRPLWCLGYCHRSCFWVGIVPNILRNSVINAAEIASYDQYKQMILQYIGMRDGVPLHILCAAMAGFTACIFGSPFDVTKTRMMAGKYNGVLDCVSSTFKADGFGAFYKGFTPNFLRLASWNITMFVAYEQIKGYMFPVVKKD